MMFKYYSMALALMAGAANANPFAPKTSQNNARAKLMMNAVPTKNSQIRHLEDANAAADVDLTSYSLRFEKCQFVKGFSQELAEDADSTTVLATSRFVIFRLCPSDNCKSCNYNYGEYMTSMDDYLTYTVDYRKEQQEEMCNTCEEQCYYNQGDDANQAQGDDGANQEEEEAGDDGAAGDDAAGRKLSSSSIDCSTCKSDCDKIENMEANYYLDATNFIGCQEIKDADDDSDALYAGPICASQGSKIKIGVFTDDECMFLDGDKDVENYLTDDNGNAMKLSHALLKTTYDTSDCISCLAENDGDDDAAAAETKEVCEELYNEAAKCESAHGFSNGQSSYADDGSSNQAANEELVCDFISSLKAGTYSQDGEIVIGGSNVYAKGGTRTTGGQKFALTFFIIGTVGLAVYAAMLHSQLTKGGKADLSSQGGAMA